MLEVSGIDVFYGCLQVLWGVSFEAGEGEIVAIIGSNGAGKSTIQKTLAGLMRPAAGSIRLEGRRIEGVPAERRVLLGMSLVPEGRGLFTGMSVLENLELGAYPGHARLKRAESLEAVYDMFPVLERRKGQIAGTLSGGEQQMVAVGRGLMSCPRILLLDEPSLGLAPLVTKAIFDVLREVNRRGVSVILVEQNVRMSLELATRGYIMENGRIAGSGGADELLGSESVRSAYLGGDAP